MEHVLLLVEFSNKTSVSSAFLIVSLAAVHGTNPREPTFNQLPSDIEGVDKIGGRDVKLRPFEECARAEGRPRWMGEVTL